MSASRANHGDVEYRERFLAGFAPFDRMRVRDRRAFAAAAECLRFAADDALLSPEDGLVGHLYLVADGRVEGNRAEAADVGPLELVAGDMFPLGALLGERATRTRYRAASELVCYRLDRDAFTALFTNSEPFRDFCIRGVSSLLERVRQNMQVSAAYNLGAESRFDTPLSELARAHPVTCRPDVPVRDAVQTMHDARVGSIVVTDEEQRPRGIFTLHDLRALIAGHGDLDAPIERAMTPSPHCLGSDSLAFEAVLLMARRHVRHIVVTERGRVAGVVSDRDLFALQRINVVHIMRAITTAEDVDQLARARADVQPLIDSMMAHGAGVEQMVRIITLLNDRTVVRAIELCLASEDDPGVPFTWIAFGSEGRCEQTLVTDQDNGMLFDAGGEDVLEVRQRLLPIARRINEVLDRCGFPLCKGNIMASNPKLCLSFDEWERTFGDIIASSTPENLLRSSIYFDFRPVWGDEAIANHLYGRVLDKAAGSSLFLHMMAGNALASRPPLGLFRDFVTERSEEAPGDTLDLKVRGLTPFVDGARLLSLEGRIAQTSTLERFRAIAEAEIATPEEAQAWARSFAFIQMLRMRLHQEQAREGRVMNNRLDPDTLNPMDRHILKEAFRQARRLQKKLEIRYHV